MEQTALRAKLFDVLRAGREVRSDISDRSYEEFLADRLLRQSTYWQLMIIGEALNQAAKIAPDLRTRLPDLQDIVGLRNRIVHAYGDTNDRVIWFAITDRLHELIAWVETFLNEGTATESC